MNFKIFLLIFILLIFLLKYSLIFRGVYSISTFNDFYRLFLSDRLSWILMDFDGFIQSS